MIKRILAALAVTMLGVLAFATPAHATIPEIQLPWEVTFSADDCSGLTKVTLSNNITRADVGLVFTVDGDPIPVGPDSSKVVDVVYPNSLHIVVDLTGIFDADPEIETAKKADLVLVKHWEHDWQRPAGCWKVTVDSQCNGDQELTVVNTAPDASQVLISVDTTTAVVVPVAGGATFSAVYGLPTFPAQSTVTVVVDKETTSTFPWEQPTCPSPLPTRPAPNPGNPGVLPETGQDLSTEVLVLKAGGGLAVLALGAWALYAVLKRRRTA